MQRSLFQYWITPTIGVIMTLLALLYIATNSFGHDLTCVTTKLSLLTSGIGLIIGYFYWQYLIAQPHIQTDFQHFRARLASCNLSTRPFVRTWFILLGTILTLLIITEEISQTPLGHQAWWTAGIIGENGFWENLEAFVLFIALLVYLRYFFYHRELPQGWLTALVICGFSFILIWTMGEETDWGQVWFGFATPPEMKAHSVAGTFALHELVIDGEDMNEVASFGVQWLYVSYGIVLPVLMFLFADLRYILSQLRLPVPHIAFSFWVFLTLIFQTEPVSLFVLGVPYEALPWSLSEVRESILYLLFLGAVLYSTKFWSCATRDVFK